MRKNYHCFVTITHIFLMEPFIMNVDEALLSKLEKLSQIKIDDTKRQETIGQLQNVLSFVENLSEIETQNDQTKFLMTQDPTHLRADSARDAHTISDEILDHAPKSEGHLFVVPKIIE